MKRKMKMKKLFVATAAIALAVATQAASIDWSVGANTWTMSDGSKPPKNTVVYLIDGAQWATISAAIDGGATSFTTADAGIIAVGQTSNTKGYVNGGTATSSSLVAGQTYNFAYMVFDTAAGQFYASKATPAAAYDPSIAAYSETTYANFDGASFTTTGLSGGWTTGGGSSPAIPEPTSGILLLVGAGMLALRRKQK